MAVICSEFVRGGVVLRLKCVLRRSNWYEIEIYLHIYVNNNTMRDKVKNTTLSEQFLNLIEKQKIRHCRNSS